jgi:hypothetical protein
VCPKWAPPAGIADYVAILEGKTKAGAVRE